MLKNERDMEKWIEGQLASSIHFNCVRKVTYLTESEAIAAIPYVKRRWGKIMYHYQCRRCGHWHLATNKRQVIEKKPHISFNEYILLFAIKLSNAEGDRLHQLSREPLKNYIKHIKSFYLKGVSAGKAVEEILRAYQEVHD